MTARAGAAEDGATHAIDSVLLDHERRRLEADLVARFCPPIPPQVVRACVDESLARYALAPVRTYLRILVERAAVARLRHLVLAGTVVAPETLVDLAAAESWPRPEDDLAIAPEAVREASRCRHLRSDDRVVDAATPDIRPRQRETAP